MRGTDVVKQSIDWPDLRRVAWHYAWPAMVWAAIIWWFGFEAVATYALAAIFWCALACVPFAFVHIVTNGR